MLLDSVIVEDLSEEWLADSSRLKLDAVRFVCATLFNCLIGYGVVN